NRVEQGGNPRAAGPTDCDRACDREHSAGRSGTAAEGAPGGCAGRYAPCPQFTSKCLTIVSASGPLRLSARARIIRAHFASKVEIAPRRPGDPAQIVAATDRARIALGWKPQYDDLATIIAHPLAWEQGLRD